ncbi:phosphonate C-P lyase system protein PhnG [Cognatishimia sp. SS12]|uniref:phosphonate C-P lyase system protein PhnG n=1 Tax=Cognatishimia sp. SS12 TaxID=2979465 RepID=UPI00232C1370|nr:phosphonate C-P lyase system protein PhnG [Cognatishimia sp. SS12]MDC0738690.1 phosphonate C-P lyase system protein PhnG [Cognatishimia sp. SS12]
MPDAAHIDRRGWLSLLAKAPDAEFLPLFDALGTLPDFDWLRAPEVGSVMVQGRMGATGAPFNLGEMTVTRCSLQLPGGQVGHGYVQGRSKPAAKAVALVDALMQTDAAARLRADILAPLMAGAAGRAETRARKAAATKVEFFTMARGED